MAVSDTSEVNLGERYSFFPIKDEEMYKQYKIQEACIWSSSEMDFSRDKEDYEKLPDGLRKIIDYVNAFFSSADGIIIDNICLRFLREAKSLEEQAFFITQMFVELVHSETYSLIINTTITDTDRRNDLFMAANNLECVKNKNLWLHKHINSNLSKAERLMIFAAGEGIFFTSSFLFIFYFRSKGLLPTIVFANEQISKDEGIHRDTGVLLYNREQKLEDFVAHDLIRTAVELECKFVDELLPEIIDDLDPHDVKNYVKFLGDRLLQSCKHKTLYDIKISDFPTWIRDISLEQKSNFHELKVGNYSRFNLSEALDWKQRIIGRQKQLETACTDPSQINF